MNLVTFSPAQRAQRLADYRDIAARANAIYAQIPAQFKDAYYELVFYPVTAAALQNEKFLLARDSLEMAAQDDPNALKVAAQAQDAYDQIARITDVYNNGIAGGKWRYIMDWKPNNRAPFQMPKVATADMIGAAKTAAPIEIPLAAGTFAAPMQLKNGVLGGASPDVQSEATGGSATFPFDSPASETAPLWAWVSAPSPDEDSWFFDLNGKKTVVNDKTTGAQWKWIKLGDFALKAGQNTLTIGQREPNARIQKLRFGGDDPTAPTDALLQIAGADFVQKTDTASAKITKFAGFGQGDGSVTILPVTAPSVAPDKAASAIYQAQLPAGSRSATLRFLPTSAINETHGLRVAVSINGAPPQILDLNAQEFSKEWGDNVLRGFSQREMSFEQKAGQKTNVEVKFLDPGLVLETIDFR